MELGDVLRDRRKAAGRTIASVAVDAGLSVPYIANLENGRGNPTLAALDRLATALGARLDVRIDDEAPAPPPSAAAELLAASVRADKILAALSNGRSRATVRRDLITTLDALQSLLGHPPTPADLNRLLDLLQLSRLELG
ncbi:transcriptional regulator with XRE-family HTH domain [Kribbella aluminosa]|uniref:Transcriptional regulator with XRE-family HTH domain n=1 Tax=Kribbella aluminosa TaxID=416017 RepID=A0ABS4URH6_9ACTN|nr:helix-turn-helix transcriptional regulator [Kribbella aluminosa]MBP2354240.1 transcriptional regulator with XRE-family HTH domain [Kribbella aluminosa]